MQAYVRSTTASRRKPLAFVHIAVVQHIEPLTGRIITEKVDGTYKRKEPKVNKRLAKRIRSTDKRNAA